MVSREARELILSDAEFCCCQYREAEKSQPVAAKLKCPFCDKPYLFHSGAVSICPSCDLQIRPGNPDERVPRIRKSKKSAWIGLGLLITGIVVMWFFPPYGAVLGFSLVLAFFALAQSLGDRCGNCGAKIAPNRASFCGVCRAEFDSTVT